MNLKFITVEEAAEALRCSPDTVKDLIRRGRLPAYRIGRAMTRITEEDLWNYVRESRVRPEGEEPEPAGPMGAGMRELNRQRKAQELARRGYVPGMKVV